MLVEYNNMECCFKYGLNFIVLLHTYMYIYIFCRDVLKEFIKNENATHTAGTTRVPD